MKKLLLLFIASIAFFSLRAQTDASVMLFSNQPLEYSSGISSADNSYIATLSSGENIVASVIKDPSAAWNINIKKIQSNGAVVTLNNIAVPAATALKGFSCSASGNYTCLLSYATDLYLLKLDATGAMVFQKKIKVPDLTTEYYDHSLNETPSGDYYVTVSNFSFMGLIKVDSNGNILWNKKIAGPRDMGKSPGFCSEVTLSGGCISTIKDDSYETIVNLAADGSLIWSRSFGDLLYRWPKTIKADNLGNFYIMGTYGNGGATFFQKMDANGNIVFAKNISGATSYEDAFLTNTNDYFLLSENPTLELTKLDASGNILWNRGIGVTTSRPGSIKSTYFSKTKTSNISFLSFVNDTVDLVFKFSGAPSELCNSYSFPSQNITDDDQLAEASIDSTAHIDPLTITVTDTSFTTSAIEYYTSQDFCSFVASINEMTVSVSLNIYPNPSTDLVNISFENINKADLKDAIISIYDVSGKKVFEKLADNSTISTVGYTDGIYFVILSNRNKILGKQKLVVQK